MWIRSQDKTTLIKSEYITLYGNVIKVVCSDMTCITIGEYSSQEKALKVLDMIQNCIEHNSSHQNSGWDSTPHLVYDVFQMPLDSEVSVTYHLTDEDRNGRV